jgi:protein-L-isoaspartate(D-aspartate) O-methyltransferase
MNTRRTVIPLLLLASIAGGVGASDPDSASKESPMDYAGSHQRMLEAVRADVARNDQVLGRGRLSAAVDAAMAAVPRHEFVPPELARHAYENRPLSIGHGQTISQPTIVALMTDLLALEPSDRVLEVGTGSGYQAAVLSEVVPDGRIHTIEIVPELARSARKRLKALAYDNVRVHTGDGYLGLPGEAPFQGIMVTAASEEIPPPLIEQLAPDGRLVMPVGSRTGAQWLTLLAKDEDGEISRRVLLPVRFVPLTGDHVDR